jgi:hypothetical protein
MEPEEFQFVLLAYQNLDSDVVQPVRVIITV